MFEATRVNIEDVKQAVRALVLENFLFGNLENWFEDEESFMEKGIIDSTGILELIEFIESKYGVKTKDEELVPENFDSLMKVSLYVLRKLNGVGDDGEHPGRGPAFRE